MEHMTWLEVRGEIEAGTPIMLPVGAIEQHGPHLPLGTDGFIPGYIAGQVAARRRLVVAPTMFYGAYSMPRRRPALSRLGGAAGAGTRAGGAVRGR
jgi:creatinine amidohydrolase